MTVNRTAAEGAPGGILPTPLAALGDRIEGRITPAPDGKGTEIGARLRAPEPAGPAVVADRLAGSDPRLAVRSAPRESKADRSRQGPADRPATRRAADNHPRWQAARHRYQARAEGVL